MSVNPGPPGNGARRRSPDELAQEVASLLKGGASGHPERRLRIDIVTVSRIVMALVVVLFGVGVAVAVPWIGGLVGFETPGMVTQGGPIVGCPGEIEIGEVFKGETVQVVGRTDDGLYFALRDERGPGDVVYVDAEIIIDVDDEDLLPPRSCEPRDEGAVLAAATTVGPGDPIPTTTAVTPTSIAGDTTTTVVAAGPDGRVGRPPRRGTATPGAPTTTTPPSTAPNGPQPTTTTWPGSSTPTSRPSPTTSTTRPPGSSSTSSTTTTTRPPTTTSSTTTSTTTTTTQPTTTTTEVTTTTTEPETTTTEPVTTSTDP
jgi:hypothetical protein